MKCPNCQTEYDASLEQCPHCQTANPEHQAYHKPSHVCKNCATPLQKNDRYCPSCGFDQQRSIVRQTSSGKATRFIGPMIGLFAFLLLVALSLGAAYYFISQANSDDAVRSESVVIVKRSSNETIARLKENADLKLSEAGWARFRELLSLDDYRTRMADALNEIRTGDLMIEPGDKTLRYIPTHRLSMQPVDVEITTGDASFEVILGDETLTVPANDRILTQAMPGIYRVIYRPDEGKEIEEEVEISHHAIRYQAGKIELMPRLGAFLPTIRTPYQTGRIFINGRDSGLTVKDVDERPQLLGVHPPGTVYQLKIDTVMGQVLSNEVEQTDGPISFELQNGLVLARSETADLVFVNGEKVGTYGEFASSGYVVGPIEVGKDIVRIQGEGTEQTPFEATLAESMGGKEIELELTDDLKRTLIAATRRFTLDSFQSLKQETMDTFTNVLPDSEIEIRLRDSLDLFKQGGGELDYVPFAIRFSNDSFKVYAKDGRAYAELIESYFIKYTETEYQNHTSWLKKLVYDQGLDKWFFYQDELLYEYTIPEDNTLVFLE